MALHVKVCSCTLCLSLLDTRVSVLSETALAGCRLHRLCCPMCLAVPQQASHCSHVLGVSPMHPCTRHLQFDIMMYSGPLLDWGWAGSGTQT